MPRDKIKIMPCKSTALDTWTVSGSISSSYGLLYDQHCAINSVPEIIITGSCDPYNDPCLNAPTSTIYTGDGVIFAELPPIPVALTHTCVVALDDNDLFVTGGSYVYSDSVYTDYSDKSYLYHSDTKEWEELPGLLTTRDYHMCARVHNSNGEEEVIVAGGYSCGPEDCDFLDLVDIYNIQSREWRKG